MTHALTALGRHTLKLACALWALAFAVAPAAQAQESLGEGTYVMIGKSYDYRANTFSDDVPEGERSVCFQITKITDTEMELQHISGSYRPAWGNETYAPGTYNDTWFSSTAYLESNPDADPLGELVQIFKPVATCP